MITETDKDVSGQSAADNKTEPAAAVKPKRSNMATRVITGVIILGVVLGGFVVRYYDTFFFDALILFISIMALIEVSNALVSSGRFAKPLMFFLIAHVIISYILIKLAIMSHITSGAVSEFFSRFAPASRYSSYLYLSVEIPLLFVFMFISSFFIKTITLDRMVSTAFVMFYPTILLIFMLSINNIYPIHENFTDEKVLRLFGFFGLAVLFATSMLSDTMAFLVGISVKGPKLCPKLSPKKTISGAVGGLIGGFAGAMIVFGLCNIRFFGEKLGFSIFDRIPFYHFIIMGLMGSVFTQVGDLAASYLKRSCGIKDFSNAFPGHGGFMDRLDGLMFNSIFIYFYILVFIIFLF